MSKEEGATPGGIRSYARNLTTRSQVNGYRFLLSRMEHALVRRDIRMLHDPMRSQSRSLSVGLVLSILLLAGCGIWAYFSPNRLIKQDDSFIYGKESGARYVLVNGKLHPVLNAVSAWLITGRRSPGVAVKESELGSMPRGPLVGIIGAPDTVMSTPVGESNWSVCDTTQVGLAAGVQQEDPSRSTKVPTFPEKSIKLSIIEEIPGTTATGLGPDGAFLVTFHKKNYLVYGEGKRAEVNLDPSPSDQSGGLDQKQADANNAVMDSYGLLAYRLKQDITSRDAKHPREISEHLFNSLEELRPVVPPVIPHIGEPPPAAIAGVLVGSVVRAFDEHGKEQFYVVESTGRQPITEAMAKLIRLAYPQVGGEPRRLESNELNRLQPAHELDVDWYPSAAPKILDPDQSHVICYNWSKKAGDSLAKARLLTGNTLPVPAAGGRTPVELASADGGETVDTATGVHHNIGVDEVYVPPGTGFFAQGIGNMPSSEKHGSVFYIADTGVRFGIQSLADAIALGLPAGAKPDGSVGLPVPWGILDDFPQGPALARLDALVELDSAQPADKPAPMIAPKQGAGQ